MQISQAGGLIGRLAGSLFKSRPQAEAATKFPRDSTKVSPKNTPMLVDDGKSDRVELSPQAPRPLAASLLIATEQVANKLREQTPLTKQDAIPLRENRVFAAVVALQAVGADGKERLFGWPGGIPAPSSAELEAAYRQVAQRISQLDNVRNPDRVQALRQRILDSNQTNNFSNLADVFKADA